MAGLVAVFLGSGFSSPARAGAGPDTLVIKAQDGTFSPGIATSWRTGKDAVSFVLTKGADIAAVAQTLRQRLANVEVTVEKGELKVRGVDPTTLLSQLASLSLLASADPLAELSGMSGQVVAMQSPEAGGSIRASKPTPLPPGVFTPPEPGPEERYDAEIIDISRSGFPLVTLKVKIVRAASVGTLAKKLRRGDQVDAHVFYSEQAGRIDYADPITQRNLAAYYAAAGDRYAVHLIDQDGHLVVDWIERAQKHP